MDKETLHLDYTLHYSDFRQSWLDSYKKSLPNIFTFWGTAFVISLILLIITDDKLLFTLISFTLGAIPISIAVFN